MAGPKTQRIAVIDDEARIRESLENLLETAGFSVRAFGSAEAFLEHPELASFDCLISDIGMPEMDGFALRKQLTTLRPELPVILITGREGAHQAHAPEAPIFRKPFDVEELLRAVSTALARTRR